MYIYKVNYAVTTLEPGQLSRYSDSLRAGWSGDRIPVEARFSAPVQTGPWDHPASYTMSTGSFPGISSQGMALTTHLHLVPRLKEEQSYTSTPPQGLHGLFQGELDLNLCYISKNIYSMNILIFSFPFFSFSCCPRLFMWHLNPCYNAKYSLIKLHTLDTQFSSNKSSKKLLVQSCI